VDFKFPVARFVAYLRKPVATRSSRMAALTLEGEPLS